MFLNLLHDKEKEEFLSLAIKAAESNGKVESVETDMITAFAKEMDIKPFYKTSDSLEELLNSINENSTITGKQIILFELAGLLLSDATYDEDEKKFYHFVADKLNISEEKVEQYVQLIDDYTKLYRTIYNEVLA